MKKTNKFHELMLYVAQRSEKDDNFGAVKLNKILFYSDFLAYVKLGKSITGENYRRLPKGPAPVRLVKEREVLVKTKRAARKYVDRHGRTQDRLLALCEPDMSDFSGEEVAVVAQVLDSCSKFNGEDISDLSHNFHGWLEAKDGEVIPYETALVSSRKATEEEKQSVNLKLGSPHSTIEPHPHFKPANLIPSLKFIGFVSKLK